MAKVIKHVAAPVSPPPVLFDILGMTRQQFEYLSDLCLHECSSRCDWTFHNQIFNGGHYSETVQDL